MKKNIFILLVTMFSINVFAATVTDELVCSSPTTRADNSTFDPGTELDHYNLYMVSCTDGAAAVKVAEFGPDCKISHTFDLPKSPCVVGLAVSAVDKLGLESAMSNIVNVTNSVANPSPPTGITAKQTVTVNVQVQVQ